MAGVSHAAPAHHFDGLRGLKTAIAARGFGVFEKLMKDGVKTGGDDKKARAMGMCQGYIKFATEQNALFNLVFDKPDKPITDPEWMEAAASARKVLDEISSQFVDGPGGEAATAITFFSLVHGYSKLIEIGRVVSGSGDGRDVKFEDLIAMMNLELT